MRILGVIPAYNEADCIPTAYRAMRRITDDVHIFDHGSTDDTPDVTGATIHHMSRKKYPIKQMDGVQSSALWHAIGNWIRQQDADIVVWHDADEFLRQPDQRLADRESIILAMTEFDVIRPLLREYTYRPGPGHYLQKMKMYRRLPMGHSPRVWEHELTPNPLPIGMHVQDPATGPAVHPHYIYWPEGTRVSNKEWFLEHYPFRSEAQVKRKLDERNWLMPIPSKRERYKDERKNLKSLPVGHKARDELEMP
jgi:hypothetical protein